MALPNCLTFSGWWEHSENFSASITTMQAVIWIVTFLACTGADDFIRYSRMGRACRACAEDLKMASLLGINTDRVIALTFVIWRGDGGGGRCANSVSSTRRLHRLYVGMASGARWDWQHSGVMIGS